MPLPLIAFAVAVKATETAIVWYYGGAAVCVVAGGTAYFMWPSSRETPLTPDQINQIKTNADEIAKRQQQPIIVAKAILANTAENIKTVIVQTCEQQTHIDSSVHQLTQTAIKADDATTQIITITQPLRVAANDAVNHVQAMTDELATARRNFDELTTALQKSQESLAKTEGHLRETHGKLTTTQEELVATTTSARNQLSQLLQQQQLIDEAFKKINLGSIQGDEIKSLKQQIMNLSSKNQILSETVNKLSKNIILVIEENKTLRAENIALKITITLLTSEKQPISGQPNSEPPNANPYKPSMFR